MTFLEERNFEDVPSIPEYYKGKTIFVTGGSGFMGKALVEKLLYSCPGLDRIYLLLRPKKGVKPEARLSAIYSSNCFIRLRNERPGLFESKVFFIEGDCTELGLGLSEEDRTLLVNRTNIIFHFVASVRFDDLLKKAVDLNIRGAKYVLELAKDVHHLESFVHVSTSFCNTNRNPIEEVMYPPHADWRELLDICDDLDNHTINVMTPKFIGELPNTYTFTKQLAEHMIYEQRGKMPIVITRPSIVVASISEPMPGYIDNFNGPVGIIVASGKGILRSLYADPNVLGDFIPLDIAIKGLIIASWTRGTKKLAPSDDIPIYNTCTGLRGFKMSAAEMLEFGHRIISAVPLEGMVWSVGGSISFNKLSHFIKVLFLHVLPAIFLDTLLWLFGKRTMVLKVQRRIYTANNALAYFLTHIWIFCNKNFMNLRSILKEEDKPHFYFVMENVDVYEYYKIAIHGARRYLLKYNEANLPKARKQFKRLTILNKLVKYFFYGYIFWRIINSDNARNFFYKLC